MSSHKMTPEDLESLFEDSYTTIFCSHNSDGTIHAAPIWYRYRDGVFYFVSIKKSRRVANVRRNKNVSLSFLMQGTQAIDGDVPSRCALVYGAADLGFEPETGYDEYVRWVWGKYESAGSDPNQKFDHKAFVTLKVTPSKIVNFYP
jgi:nitroimidazol reductase NimA-like FMN-containing flavoprotein (pyridoxamine 5'-phosphate oxidase superfamily)